MTPESIAIGQRWMMCVFLSVIMGVLFAISSVLRDIRDEQRCAPAAEASQ